MGRPWPLLLLHVDTMWPRLNAGESGAEVQLKAGIQGQPVILHVNNVDLVVTIEMNNAGASFIEEVIGYHQALLVTREQQIMRGGTRAKVYDRYNACVGSV